MWHGKRPPRRLFTKAIAGLASLGLVAGLVLVGPTGVQAAPGLVTDPTGKIQPELRQVFQAADRADFWVRFAAQADLSSAAQVGDWAGRGAAVAAELRATAQASQAAVADALADPAAGGVTFEAFWATNAIYVHDGPVELAEQLAGFSEVQGLYKPVGYDLVAPTPGDQENGINAVEWGIANINADDVWDQFGVRGEGVTVASIDTGTQFDHPALVAQYRGNLGGGNFDHNYHWFDAAGNCPSAPCDLNDHGTHTMGTMVGDDGGVNQVGVAPRANWITANGCCPSDAALIASGQWMLEPTDLAGQNPDASKRPHIVNNSWGTQTPSNDPFMEDVLAAWAASGIFGVWSNGNNGSACATSGSPGSRIINYSVGAYDINNTIAGFSSRGPGQDGEIKPNLAAPGVNVRSSVPTNGYANFNGTSMAAPHTAGSIALLWSAAPALVGDIEATRALLDDTATDTEDLQCGGTADDNNVFGEGRLDALALLQAAPIGETGTLAGTVTDAATGAPIAGAAVHVTGDGVDRTLSTGADGTYTTVLSAGDYTLEASAFGYQPQTRPASITAGQTSTEDFALDATPQVTVTGLIRDGSGHGWPIYAKVNVDGAPDAAAYTNPFTGRYRLRLPANASYTLTIESQYPGYSDLTETIEVGASNLVRDLEMTVSIEQCRSAPGYRLDQPAIAMVTSDPGGQFADYFDSLGIQVDIFPATQLDQITGYDLVLWGYHTTTGVTEDAFLALLDRTDADGTGVVFLDHAFTTGNGIKTLSRFTGNPTAVTTSTGGAGQENLYQVTQEHPILDGFAVGDEIIHEPDLTAWVAWFDGYEGEGRQVIADLGRTGDGMLGSGIGVQERANNRHVLMSIHSSSATRGPEDWSPDSERIFFNAVRWATADAGSFECVPVDGGLVAGHVRDRNTGAGVNNATVTSVDRPEETTTSFATPDDAQRADGFYWMFSSLTGNHRFTASAGNYTSLTRVADVDPDWTTRRNFRLAAGQLAVTPGGVEAEVPLGGAGQRSFTITNTGTAPAEVELSERDGSFEILRADGTRISEQEILAALGAPLRRVEAAVSDRSAAAGGGLAGAGSPQAVPQDEPWQDLASYPFPVMDNVADVWEGQVYSITGIDNASNWHDETMRFDPVTGSWTALAAIPTPREKPAGAIIDGRFYVVGGWAPSGATVPTLEIYDIGSDSWSTGAPIPVARSASATAVLDGKLYLVGGCQAACGATDVWVYDPAADSWAQAAPYPQVSSWTHCGGIDGLLYCAGSSQGAQDTGYVYDPAANSWQPIASLPTTVWGGSYVAANGKLLVSGGVVGGSITNQGFAYDPATDSWAPLPNSNNLLYRGAGACGFYRIGGAVSNFNAVPDAELLPGFDGCGAVADVPWLAVDPTVATLQPGDSVQITVRLTADVAQPGAYTATIPVRENTPYAVAPVDVTMNVTPPATWGKLTGTVTGIGCDGTTAPLADATVHLSTWVMELTLFTDADGGYAHWLDWRHSPFFVIVAKDGYQPQFRQTSITPGEITTEDWSLRAVCATSADQPEQHVS